MSQYAGPVALGCSCTRHLDDELLQTVVPFAASLHEDIGYLPDPVTVRDLLHPGGLSVSPTDPEMLHVRRRCDGPGRAG